MDINKLIDSLTQEEKITLLSGADQWHTRALTRLGIPAIMVADGPHGLRKQDAEGDRLGIGLSKKATCFPTAATSANSWDPELLFAMGKAIGEEALQEGVSVVLGPGVNIKRSPLCGRNFEYFSEDPWLTGELATAWIEGIQSVGVGACIKHFAANNQERWRMLNDSLVDERALREIYLAPFEKAVRSAQPWTLMPAYNKLNGTYCCENPKLLDSILRREWGFAGATISDWGAVNDPTLSIKAGLDLEMPASWGVSAEQVGQDLSSGRLTEQELNKSVRRVLELVYKSQAKRQEPNCDLDANHALAQRIAAESAVLLKNDEDILPLSREQTICVLGQFAEHPRYQGTGSSLINPTRLDTILELLESEAVGVDYTYARGYELEHDGINEALISEACVAAAKADVAVIFAGLTPRFESEGYDRTHLELPPSHNELIRRVAQANSKVVVVLSAGAPVDMPWLHDVKGVLHTYLGGQGGAGAIVDLLYGRINPSGKLAESYPLKLDDCLANGHFANHRDYTEYRESIFVGYRYYDAAEKDVLFPFGYGLSYTQFTYENLEVSDKDLVEPEVLRVRCTVKNAGERGGSEIVQLYLGKDNSTLFRAPRELKGFQKIYLEPGEEKTVEFVLHSRAFAYYNVDIKDWHVESGEYQISVGASSRNLPLQDKVHIESNEPGVNVSDYRLVAPAYYRLDDAKTQIPREDFQALYGSKYPQAYQGVGRFHTNSTLQDLQVTLLGRLVLAFAKKYLWKMTGAIDENDPLWIMSWTSTLEMPLRSIVPMSGGAIPAKFVRGLLAWVNGKPLQALRLWIFS
ncbi:MAG TPA: glycoside hydrolase family 3 C-terminal domain-containing protein [Limnochordia bacterium]|nr:glycoside hydrolase family 3 C-terminal domain-containing protein [Limnochordia bacterium]